MHPYIRERHSRQHSAVSSSRFPLGGSSNWLSRTSSNTHDYLDNVSLRTLDRIPAARPSITYADKLWTQIDVLDDVKNMASQVKERGSFFNDQFNEDLNKLKNAHDKLLEVMASQQYKTSHYDQQGQFYKSGGAAEPFDGDDGDPERKQPSTQDKFREFFQGKRKELDSNIIYKKQNFDEMNQYVHEVKQNLDTVGESMKKFDETTRNLW